MEPLMTEVAHTGSPMLYLGFSVLVVVFLVLDFVLLKAKGQHKVPVVEALAWAVVWFVAAMAFAGWYWWFVEGVHGREIANDHRVRHRLSYRKGTRH
jgi:tellurite resistance protein TerC